MIDKEKATQIKDLTKKLLEIKGLSFDEWLYGKQLEFVTENSDVLINALNTNLNKKGD